MFHLRRVAVLVVIVACCLQTLSAEKYRDEYTDEKRPYEFGFTIDGEQHRQEKKDEDGLIMGEFGFITADGVYHVTVYATDENGNFKILSMKNIRVKPYPTAPEKKALDFPPSKKKPLTQGPDIKLEEPARSCSHCSIPTTKAPELTDIAVVSVDNPAYNQQQYPDNYPQYPPYPEQPQEYPQDPAQPQEYPQDPAQPQEYPQYPAQPQEYPQDPAQYPEQSLQPGERNPKQYDEYPGQNPNKPVLISAQMQIVDKNTDINYKAPGETDGLPNGLQKQDMQLLLYTFNYTVGFHGHHEEGYTNGFKKGYYFVTGRNGVKTRVDYEADDKGFRPKISQEVLDLLSDEVPKEETEKEPQYGLKGYEFKWIYYPVESRRR